MSRAIFPENRGYFRAFSLWLLAALCACSRRGCSSDSQHEPVAVADVLTLRDRCAIEIAHASVAVPLGFGAIDSLTPTCGNDGTLTVWAMRGHTLSRLTRSRDPGSRFGLAEVVATGADRLGPIANDGALGPVAWRSPTAPVDDLDGDEWWAAVAVPGDGGSVIHRGSALMPNGTVGLGIIAPLTHTTSNIEVLTSLAQSGVNPHLVRWRIPVPSDEVEMVREQPASLGDGELKAWEPTHRMALAFEVEPGGAARLRVLSEAPEGRPMTIRGEIPLPHAHLLVVPHGESAADVSLFAYSEFDTARREDGHCLAVDESLCVAPGPVVLVRIDAAGVTTIQVTPQGLVDTFTMDGHGHVLLFYVGIEGQSHTQRAARIDPTSRTVQNLILSPSDELPPLDHPSLVECGGEPWMVAEVLVSDDRDGSNAPRESAIMALPAECLVRP